jgi:hypothetical protein
VTAAEIYYTADQWGQSSHVNAFESKDIEVLFVDGLGGEQLLFAIEDADQQSPKLKFRRVDQGDEPPPKVDDAGNDPPASGSLYKTIHDSAAVSLASFVKISLVGKVSEVRVAAFSPSEEMARLVRLPLPDELRKMGPMLEKIARGFEKYRHLDRKQWPDYLRAVFEKLEQDGQDFETLFQTKLEMIQRRQLMLNWDNDLIRRIAGWVSTTAGSEAARDQALFSVIFRCLLNTARISSGEPLNRADHQEANAVSRELLDHLLRVRPSS